MGWLGWLVGVVWLAGVVRLARVVWVVIWLAWMGWSVWVVGVLGWLGCLDTRNNFAFFDLSYILYVDTKFCPNQKKIGKVSILGWVRGVKWFGWSVQKYNF